LRDFPAAEISGAESGKPQESGNKSAANDANCPNTPDTESGAGMSRSNFALSSTDRVDARSALRLLAGTGFTLQDAARRVIEGSRAVRQVTVAECADAFLLSRVRANLRPKTITWYTERLEAFTRRFGALRMDAVSRAEFREWLKAETLSQSTERATTRAVRALWRWAAAQEPPMAAADITSGLRTAAGGRRKEIAFLGVEECRRIAEGAGRYRAALALELFAGVRPEEVAGENKPRLLWSAVDPIERIIRIPADISKIQGQPRVIEGLPAAIWRWIGPPGPPDSPICPALHRSAVKVAKRLAGFGNGRRWPQDGLRHSFATYAMALTNNPGQVAVWLGHEGKPTMLYRHYRGIATRAQAESFWALAPEGGAL
jgi:integrase